MLNEKSLRVLIVEYEPLMCEVYKSIFNQISKEDPQLHFELNICKDFESAHLKIQSLQTNKIFYDLAILDILLKDNKINPLCIVDNLGILIRKFSPNSRLLYITNTEDTYLYYKIFKNISPEGFILKNEIKDREFLKKGIITILNQGNIYSETITKFLKKTANQKFLLDDIDRKILFLLS